MSSKEKLKIVVDYSPSQADNDVVREGIIASNEHIVGERDKAFSIFLKNDSGKVFGGIQAFRDTESTYIDVLWVEESLQRQGYGTKLLGAVEREAIENGCISCEWHIFKVVQSPNALSSTFNLIADIFCRA